MTECRTSFNETTEQTGFNGSLPYSYYDIHCPANGGPEDRMNYLDISCAERLEHDNCTEITCKRHNRYDPDGVRPKVIDYKKNRQVGNTKRPCVCCGEVATIQGRGLISKCYRRNKRDGTLDRWAKTRNPGSTRTIKG